MCVPAYRLFKICQLEESSEHEKLKSDKEHLPADRPPPPTSAGFEAPNEKLSSSMYPSEPGDGKPWATDSPFTPLINRKRSLAIAIPPHSPFENSRALWDLVCSSPREKAGLLFCRGWQFRNQTQ